MKVADALEPDILARSQKKGELRAINLIKKMEWKIKREDV